MRLRINGVQAPTNLTGSEVGPGLLHAASASTVYAISFDRQAKIAVPK